MTPITCSTTPTAIFRSVAMRWTVAIMLLVSSLLRPAITSSRNSTSGSLARARAISIFFISSIDSCVVSRSSLSSSSSAQIAWADFRASLRLLSLLNTAPTITFSMTLRFSSGCISW